MMPYLRFKGFPSAFLHSIAPQVVDEFAAIVQIAKEKVKIELMYTEAITQVPLSVEILMFPRKQEIHDAVAAMLHRLLSESDYPNVHLFFIILSPALYYKNGEPLTQGQAYPPEDPAMQGIT